MKTIGIVGQGYVGGAVFNWFSAHYKHNGEPLVYDKFKKLGSIEELDSKADIIFVCVPTPYVPQTGYDDSAIIETLTNLKNPKIIVIKSTILPGRCQQFKSQFPHHTIFFNPEFLTARNAVNDFLEPSRQIIGYTERNDELANELMSLLPNAPFKRIVTTTEAELIKYFGNAFLATKVIYANQFYDLCQALGANYDNVKEGAAADERIGASHLEIFHEGYRGYGGFCLPKDTKALIDYGNYLGVDMSLLKEVDRSNEKLVAQHAARPLVSVIITTYNRPQYLQGALQSVLAQKYAPFEVIVVDDASSNPETAKILGEIADPRVTVLRHPRNSGGAVSLNTGLSSARGSYIAILDDDDEWIDENKLSAQVDFMEAHADHVLVGTQGIVVESDTDKEIWRSSDDLDDSTIREGFLLNNPILHSSVLFRASAIQKVHGYDISFNRGKDWDLLLRLAQTGKVAILGITALKYREPSSDDRDLIQLRLKDARAKFGVIWENRKKFANSTKALAIESGRLSVFAGLKVFLSLFSKKFSRQFVSSALKIKRDLEAKRKGVLAKKN